MARKKSYITLLNELWEARRANPEALSNDAALLYLCLLDIFNRGGQGKLWPEAVTRSDHEMAKATGLRRQSLPGYRKELEALGFLETEAAGMGRGGATKYILASEAVAHSEKSEKINRPKMAHLSEEIGQKWPNNAADTYYSIKDSTSIKTSTTTSREEVVVAAEQKKEIPAEEIYRGFYARYFDESRAAVIEQLCMNLRLTRAEFENLARACIAEWMAAGDDHRDPATGLFDEKNASRHLVNHIRVKAAANRREQAQEARQPKTRQQAAQDLMEFCRQKANRAISEERNFLQK